MHSKVTAIVIACLLLALSASGCKQVGSTVSTDDGYYTELRMSETEYQVFISKKTSVILDKLAAHAAAASNIANGEYKASAEHKNVLITITAVDEAYEDIEGIGAAIDYEQARLNLLDQLKAAKQHLTDYDAILQDEDKITKEEMENYAAEFKNDFTAIKAF